MKPLFIILFTVALLLSGCYTHYVVLDSQTTAVTSDTTYTEYNTLLYWYPWYSTPYWGWSTWSPYYPFVYHPRFYGGFYWRPFEHHYIAVPRTTVRAFQAPRINRGGLSRSSGRMRGGNRR